MLHHVSLRDTDLSLRPILPLCPYVAVHNTQKKIDDIG